MRCWCSQRCLSLVSFGSFQFCVETSRQVIENRQRTSKDIMRSRSRQQKGRKIFLECHANVIETNNNSYLDTQQVLKNQNQFYLEKDNFVQPGFIMYTKSQLNQKKKKGCLKDLLNLFTSPKTHDHDSRSHVIVVPVLFVEKSFDSPF